MFAESLLWYVGGDYKAGPSSPLSPRPEKYRAPSWSWAAVDGPCQLWHMDQYKILQRLELLETVSTATTALIYSAQQATTLKVRGRLQWCYPRVVSGGSERGLIQGIHRKSPLGDTNIDLSRAFEAGEKFGRLRVDFHGYKLFVFPNTLATRSELFAGFWCLQVMGGKFLGMRHHYGLALVRLRRTEEDGEWVFRRVGLFGIDTCPQMFDSRVPENILLV